MSVRGDLAGGGDLQIEGKVFGRIKVGHLVVAETGAVEGDIVATAVSISGLVQGSIRAGSVALTATARVHGDILHEVLAIEPGAELEGQCKRMVGGVGAKAEALGDKLLAPPSDHVQQPSAVRAAD